MPSYGVDDIAGFPASGSQNTMYVGAAFSPRSTSPQRDQPRSSRPCRVRMNPTSSSFRSHVCVENLGTFLSISRNPMAERLGRHPTTALTAYLTWTRSMMQGNDVQERSLDLILSCAACMSQLYMITAARCDDIAKDHVLCESRIPPQLCNHAFTSISEAVLHRSMTPSLPRLYHNTGNPAEWPCVRLGLCRCVMRPLYVAIHYCNAEMLSMLLRYGAEVRPEDTCSCEEPQRMHRMLRVYKTLAGLYWPPTGSTRSSWSGSISESFVRCHQLAAFVMPCHDEQLRDLCYAFAKAFSSPSQYETLLREKGSLQHLCRLTLRAALARRRPMPMGVEQLPLPKSLQRYILYQ